jgi:HK97 family phage portal protein
MKLFNIFAKKEKDIEEKAQTSPDKFLNSEIGTITQPFVTPRFNRQVAVQSYLTSGYFSAAIDINVAEAANGCLKLYARKSKNGVKNKFNTVKNTDTKQNKYLNGKMDYKPSMDVSSKILNCSDNFELVQNHPITDLFIKANPYQSAYQFFYDVFSSLEITGDAFIHVVVRPDGKPIQLYVLQSQSVDIVPGKPGSAQLVEKYIYKKDQGSPVEYSADEILHIQYSSPSSIWYGRGKIEKGWESYQLNKFSHQYQTALYANHAVPSYILINKSGQSDTNKRLFKGMKSLFRGPRKAGGVYSIDGDVSIESVAFKPKDLSDIKFTVQEIAAVTGVPLNKLVGNDQTKANTAGQDITWLRSTILPMMTLVAGALTEDLLKRYGIRDGDAFLAFDSPVPEDRVEQRLDHEMWVKSGIKSADEVRVEIGEEARGGTADELLFNGQPLGMSNQPTEEQTNALFKNDKRLKVKLDDIIKDIAKANTLNVDSMTEKLEDMKHNLDVVSAKALKVQPPIEICVSELFEKEFELEEEPAEKE